MSIKKRQRDEQELQFAIAVSPALGVSPSIEVSRAGSGLDTPASRRQSEEKTRKTLVMDPQVIHWVVHRTLLEDRQQLEDAGQLVNELCAFLRMQRVVAFLPKQRFSLNQRQSLDQLGLVLVGLAADVIAVEIMFRDAEIAYKKMVAAVKDEHSSSVLEQQSVVMTNDWRHLLGELPIGLEDLADMAADRSLVSLKSSAAAAQSDCLKHQVCVTAPMRLALARHLRGLCVGGGAAGPSMPLSEALQASALLHRGLSLLRDTQATDTVGLVSACLLLAAKACGAFKPKTLSLVVSRVYCQVFNRVLDDIDAASLEPYIAKSLLAESLLARSLMHDFFSPNLPCSLSLSLKHVMEGFPAKLGASGVDPESAERFTVSLWTEAAATLQEALRFSLLADLSCPQVSLAAPRDLGIISLCVLFLISSHVLQGEGELSERVKAVLLAVLRAAEISPGCAYSPTRHVSKVCDSYLHALGQDTVPEDLRLLPIDMRAAWALRDRISATLRTFIKGFYGKEKDRVRKLRDNEHSLLDDSGGGRIVSLRAEDPPGNGGDACFGSSGYRHKQRSPFAFFLGRSSEAGAVLPHDSRPDAYPRSIEVTKVS